MTRLSADMIDNVLVREWDSTLGYREFDKTGAVTLQRSLTAAEAAGFAAQSNGALLRSRVQQALATNKAFVNNASPTNAEVVAQVRFLTRECDAVIRLLVSGDFTDVI